MNWMKAFSAFLMVMLLTLLILHSQEEKISDGSKIILEWADTLVGTGSEGQRLRNWKGNVRFRQKDVLVKSDLAKQYLDANKLDLIGNVRITQDSLVMMSPRIFYNGNTKIAEAKDSVKIISGNTILTAKRGEYSTETKIAVFTGDVFIEDDSTEIIADKIIYHRNDENSFAYGNVIIKAKYSNTVLYADTILHYPNEDFTEALGDPYLVQIDTLKKNTDVSDTLSSPVSFELDTLTVKSMIMEAFRTEEIESYTFLDSVIINKGDISARANEAYYDKTDDIIQLYEVPIVWFGNTQLHADSIIVYTPENKLSKIHAFRNSLAATKDDSLKQDMISQITGNEIIIEIKQDSIDFIHSYGNAKSLFFDKEDNGEYSAARISSDTIKILFDLGDPSRILGLSGVNSEYFPENIILQATKDLYLPSFRWSEEKPQKLIIKR